MKIPIVINNYNLMTWPKAMVNTLLKWEWVHSILIIDNASNYKPTLNWYSQVERHPRVGVLRLRENLGHIAPFQLNVAQQLYFLTKCRYYVITDPDLDLSALPRNTLKQMVAIYESLPQGDYVYAGREGDPFNGARIRYRDKLGLSIRIDDVPNDALFYTNMEGRYYEQPTDDKIQTAPVDTTFALYSVSEPSAYKVGGVRTSAPLTCRHLPYYHTEATLQADEEFKQYLHHANYSSSSKQRFDGVGGTLITK
jgi:hypothetical protein